MYEMKVSVRPLPTNVKLRVKSLGCRKGDGTMDVKASLHPALINTLENLLISDSRNSRACKILRNVSSNQYTYPINLTVVAAIIREPRIPLRAL